MIQTSSVGATRIRAYEPADEREVRRICFRSALYGKPIEQLINDPRLVTEALLGCYLRFETAHLFVAEADGRVAGYVSACPDTPRSERLYARHVLPRLALRFCLKGYPLRPARWRFWFCATLYAARLRVARRYALADYPAHLHLNIDEEHRGRGLGSALLERSLAAFHAHRIKGVHIFAASDDGKRFFSKSGFGVLRTSRTCAVTGRADVENWLMVKNLGGQP